MFVLCVVSRDKGKVQDNQDKETSMDEVQSTREYKQNPGWGEIFLDPSRPAPRPIQSPVKCLPGLFPVCKAAGAWR
jgi:hypothetical protein